MLVLVPKPSGARVAPAADDVLDQLVVAIVGGGFQLGSRSSAKGFRSTRMRSHL